MRRHVIFLDYTDNVQALIFLAPFLGYTTAALLNNKIHMRFGQVGVAVIAPSAKLIAYVSICVHPPYPVIPIVLTFAGFGSGLQDAAWNAWIGNMVHSNELLGFLHGMYGLGATISPLIATTMITKGDLPWYDFYYIMVCFLTDNVIRVLNRVDWLSSHGTRLRLLCISQSNWCRSSCPSPCGSRWRALTYL